MKIGIIRHFKVNHRPRRYLSSLGFEQHLVSYNTSGVTAGELAIESPYWEQCFCSVLPRAMTTAQTLFKGQIIYTELLNEVPAKAIFSSRLPMPVWFWSALGRIAWFFNASGQLETRRQTQQRARQFVEQYCNPVPPRNLLIVTHGWFMLILQWELFKRGFRGRRVFRPVNGKLYLYEKDGGNRQVQK